MTHPYENSCYEYTTVYTHMGVSHLLNSGTSVYNQVLLLVTSNQTYNMLSSETYTSIR